MDDTDDTLQLGVNLQAMVDEFEKMLQVLSADMNESIKSRALSRSVGLAKAAGCDVQQINGDTVVVRTRDGERVLINVDEYGNVMLKKVD